MMHNWRGKTKRPITWTEIHLFAAICWRQGVVSSTRFRFWWQLVAIALSKPRLLYDYLTTLGIGEHFFTYRYQVRAQLWEKLATLKHSKKSELVEQECTVPILLSKVTRRNLEKSSQGFDLIVSELTFAIEDI